MVFSYCFRLSWIAYRPYEPIQAIILHETFCGPVAGLGHGTPLRNRSPAEESIGVLMAINQGRQSTTKCTKGVKTQPQCVCLSTARRAEAAMHGEQCGAERKSLTVFSACSQHLRLLEIMMLRLLPVNSYSSPCSVSTAAAPGAESAGT